MIRNLAREAAAVVIAAVALAWILAGCAGTLGGPRNTTLEVGYVATVALTACDVAGTLGATNMGAYDRETRPGYVLGEGNPVLQAMPGIGARPSVAAMVIAPAVAMGASYLIVRSNLPIWARWSWLGVVAAVETHAVTNNARWSGACGLVGTSYPLTR